MQGTRRACPSCGSLETVIVNNRRNKFFAVLDWPVYLVFAPLAAVVIIANAVALSTIERRKEIGLIKAMGAKARWVVVQLVVENSLLGFTGGAIGLALALAGMIAITSLLGIDLVTSPAIIVGVLALTVVLSSSVTLFSAVPAARERPLDILRGE